MKTTAYSILPSCLATLFCSVWLVGVFPAQGAESTTGTVTERLAAATEDVKEAGVAAKEEVESVWQRIESTRLKNRSRDELVAWIIIGLMVGGVAGVITTMRRSGLGPVMNLLLGLVGAFIGGFVVQVFDMDFGWGPVLIRYEELFVALCGAVAIVLLVRLSVWNWKRVRAKKRD